jgi:uncharacterized BrkB/YihY/UPF0761 family membrane protein
MTSKLRALIYVIAMAVVFVVALVFMLFGEASVTRAQAGLRKDLVHTQSAPFQLQESRANN